MLFIPKMRLLAAFLVMTLVSGTSIGGTTTLITTGKNVDGSTQAFRNEDTRWKIVEQPQGVRGPNKTAEPYQGWMNPAEEARWLVPDFKPTNPGRYVFRMTFNVAPA